MQSYPADTYRHRKILCIKLKFFMFSFFMCHVMFSFFMCHVTFNCERLGEISWVPNQDSSDQTDQTVKWNFPHHVWVILCFGNWLWVKKSVFMCQALLIQSASNIRRQTAAHLREPAPHADTGSTALHTRQMEQTINLSNIYEMLIWTKNNGTVPEHLFGWRLSELLFTTCLRTLPGKQQVRDLPRVSPRTCFYSWAFETTCFFFQ